MTNRETVADVIADIRKLAGTNSAEQHRDWADRLESAQAHGEGVEAVADKGPSSFSPHNSGARDVTYHGGDVHRQLQERDRKVNEGMRHVLMKEAERKSLSPVAAETLVDLVATPPQEGAQGSGVEREKLLRQWDQYRAMIAAGDTSSLPRDWFESVIDSLPATQ